MQLRSLLVADAPIDDEEARRLAELASHLVPDYMHPLEVTEMLPYLIKIREPEHDGMHHVDDPAGEAIAMLDELAAHEPQRGKLSRLVSWWRRLRRG
jgi:hypothetical protein